MTEVYIVGTGHTPFGRLDGETVESLTVNAGNEALEESALEPAAIDAIHSGRARNVLVVGAEKMTSRNTREVTEPLSHAGYQNDPANAGLSFPHVFAAYAQRYAET